MRNFIKGDRVRKVENHCFRWRLWQIWLGMKISHWCPGNFSEERRSRTLVGAC